MSDPGHMFRTAAESERPSKAATARSAPERGPRILFFSGGTALRRLSRQLVHCSHNSIHIITPFDSGGSSATLRRAFGMPAVGDLRNRLLALADPSKSSKRGMCRLAACRLGRTKSKTALNRELDALCCGEDKRVSGLDPALQEPTGRSLSIFREEMPAGFDLRGASIGNLLITGSWLHHGRQLKPALHEFARLIEALGTVRPVVDGHYHLAAELEDGRTVLGQHHITGKEVAAIDTPIRKIWLTDGDGSGAPVQARIDEETARLIAGADLICYPPGSFYTSILANLLPAGVAEAVANARCPKVYLPCLGTDPEALGLDMFDAATRLVQTLERGLQQTVHPSRLLDTVLVDTARGGYSGPVCRENFGRLGIRLIDVPLVSVRSAPLIDEVSAIEHLMSLISNSLHDSVHTN